MKLRKVNIINVSLVSRIKPRPEKKSLFRSILDLVLFSAVLLLIFYFYLSNQKFAHWANAVVQYIDYCVLVILNMPLWEKILIFAPALLFDAMRYYITNTAIFVLSVFFRRGRSKPDKSPVHPLVSVILPVRNESAGIAQALDSIIGNTYPNTEIIVVDDCSTDLTESICREYANKGQIKYFRKTVRGGKPSALNYGFKCSNGEFIVHMDGDAILYKDAIREAVQPFKDLKVGAVSCNLKVSNDKTSLATRLQAAEYSVNISTQRRWQAMTNTLQIASGAFSVFRREILEDSKGVDPETGEDLDITIKTKKLGYKVAFAPRAIAMTDAPDTFWKLFRQRIRWDECYVRLNLRKHSNIANWRRFSRGDFVAFVLDLIFNLILLLLFPVYIVLVALYLPHILIFVLVVTYLFYVLMDLWQFIIVTLLSDEPLRDIVFVFYSPIYFFYTQFLRITRGFAYIIELCRSKLLRDGVFPEKIWDNMPKF